MFNVLPQKKIVFKPKKAAQCDTLDTPSEPQFRMTQSTLFLFSLFFFSSSPLLTIFLFESTAETKIRPRRKQRKKKSRWCCTLRLLI